MTAHNSIGRIGYAYHWLLLVALIALCGAQALAQRMVGTYSGTTTGPRGGQEVTVLQLYANGDAVMTVTQLGNNPTRTSLNGTWSESGRSVRVRVAGQGGRGRNLVFLRQGENLVTQPERGERQTLERIIGNFSGTVSGTLTYRDRAALPRDAVARVQLVDTSRGRGAGVIATQTITNPGQSSVPFEVWYDPAAIGNGRTYVIQAEITVGRQPRYRTTEDIKVITRGFPSSNVSVPLTRTGGDGGRPDGRVTGTLTYRERIALSPNAVATVRLREVNPRGDLGTTLGTQTIPRAGQVPIAFNVTYEARLIDPARTYVIDAEIRDGSRLFHTGTRRIAVITRGNPSTGVPVVLTLVGDTDGRPTFGGRVTGTLTYRERISLSTQAVAEVRLVRVTPNARTTVAEQRIPNPGQVPIAFDLRYDARQIEANGNYVVEATITEGNRMLFNTGFDPVPVITRNNPERGVEVLLKPVRIAS